ncbi:MAG: metallophosphoesterase family protein [Bacillota bacterium]
MKLWVLSDTHRNLSAARRVLLAAQPGDLLVHGGDYYGDGIALAKEAGLEVVVVGGNCDWWGGSSPEEEVWEAAGVRILLTHGHQQRVKEGYDKLKHRALQVRAGLVIFGHTHIPLNKTEDGIHLFNPGSISRPRGGERGTYGIIVLQAGKIEAHIFQVSE